MPETKIIKEYDINTMESDDKVKMNIHVVELEIHYKNGTVMYGGKITNNKKKDIKRK